jgi:hypothetical protein
MIKKYCRFLQINLCKNYVCIDYQKTENKETNTRTFRSERQISGTEIISFANVSSGHRECVRRFLTRWIFNPSTMKFSTGTLLSFYLMTSNSDDIRIFFSCVIGWLPRILFTWKKFQYQHRIHRYLACFCLSAVAVQQCF